MPASRAMSLLFATATSSCCFHERVADRMMGLGSGWVDTTAAGPESAGEVLSVKHTDLVALGLLDISYTFFELPSRSYLRSVGANPGVARLTFHQ